MKHKAQQIEPRAAKEYWRRKGLVESWDYRNVWRSEHAAAFTAAKTAQTDVLGDLHQAVQKAIEQGQSWTSFKKSGIEETLKAKGWWGRQLRTNPDTGQKEEVQLGSHRRLKTIFETNMRQANNAGRYESGMRSRTRQYILYQLGPSKRHRAEHRQWDGLCLPKDDPIWDVIMPMNGWGCKCFVRFLTKKQYEGYRSNGIPRPVLNDKGERIGETRKALKTQAPKLEYVEWRNKKTGKVEQIPKGMDPGFDWNPGQYGRSAQLANNLVQRAKSGTLKNSEKWLQQYFQHLIVRADYQRFVRQAKAGEAFGFSAVGLLSDWALEEFAERGGRRKRSAKTGLLLLDAKLLGAKDDKHELAPGSTGLSLEQWLDLPNWLQHYDKVTWDRLHGTMIFWRKLEDGWGMVAVGISEKDAIAAIAAKVDHIRTAYIYTEKNWEKILEFRKNRDVLIKEK
ncbi:MAG: phage minor head protein [Spirochaetota bacterium]